MYFVSCEVLSRGSCEVAQGKVLGDDGASEVLPHESCPFEELMTEHYHTFNFCKVMVDQPPKVQ